MATVIEVKGLSKKYRIGKAEKRADTITGTLVNALKSPLRNLRQIGNLSRLDRDEDSVFWALRDVSFEVKQGEVLGIIGHNGAGKSTLLKILSRITEPTAGEVRISGRVAALLEVGTGFHPELTGRENIYMNGTILGMRKKEIDTRLDEIVAFSGVETYLDTPVKFYSSGMRVRLGFSVAAHLEPEILIIDEVLAVGDAEFQSKCLGKMHDVATEGRTVIFVSHNLSAVNTLCKKGIVLSDGSIISSGTQTEALIAYKSDIIDIHSNQFVRDKKSQEIIKTFEVVEEFRKGEDVGNVVSIGSNVLISIDLDSGEYNFDRCGLSIGLFNMEDQLVVAFKSTVQYNRPWSLKGKKEITIKWNSVNLMSGDYYFKCAFTSDMKTIDDLLIARRITIVLDKDVYNSGNSVNQTQGLIVPTSTWII